MLAVALEHFPRRFGHAHGAFRALGLGGVLNREVPVSIAHHGTDDCGLNAVLRRLEVAPLQRERLLRTQTRVQEEVPQWVQPVASRLLQDRGDLLSGEERRGPLDLLGELETCRRIGRQELSRLDRPLERLMRNQDSQRRPIGAAVTTPWARWSRVGALARPRAQPSSARWCGTYDEGDPSLPGNPWPISSPDCKLPSSTATRSSVSSAAGGWRPSISPTT